MIWYRVDLKNGTKLWLQSKNVIELYKVINEFKVYADDVVMITQLKRKREKKNEK